MNILESLILDGKQLIDEYNRNPKEKYSQVNGIEYESWMGKIKLFAESSLIGNPIKDELDALYKKRNNYLGTMAVEKMLGILYAVQSVELVKEVKRDMKIFISHSSKDKIYGDLLVELLKGLGLRRDEIIYTSNDLYGIPLKKIYMTIYVIILIRKYI
ncbi:MAG: hypothetical protein ACI4DK_07760 [Lachnospiraceae bacterium]